jgi:hypothetical protein
MARRDWEPIVNARSRTAKIPLMGTVRGFAVIDLRDLNKVTPFTWHCVESTSANGKKKSYSYVRATKWDGEKRVSIQLGRLILGAGEGDHVIYKNEDSLDNRRSNLHLGDKAESEQARGSRGGTSKFKGVFWDQGGHRWRGSFTVPAKPRGKTVRRSFVDEKEAARWVDEMARDHYGPLAPMNFPGAGEKSARSS